MNEQTKHLIDLLKRAAHLGLTFDRGSAYISREYVVQQEKLREEINRAIEAAEKE